jgi:uncharacterized protein YdaU (DUF1376 family)
MSAPARIFEVPFHIGDFLSGTLHMDATETGAYWMLCVAHYQAGEQGLPNDDVKLARMARVSLPVWKRIRATIVSKFSVEGDFLRHKRVCEVIAKISEKSADRAACALKRWNSGDAKAVQKQSECNANQKPLTDKVLNPEGRISSARGGRAAYDVESAVHGLALIKAKARARELNRDFRHLCSLYNAFVATRGEPGDADAAFLGWIEKFTEGKAL